ncbi:MAG: dihydropteroate synthase [Planctomycetota bacterium]
MAVENLKVKYNIRVLTSSGKKYLSRELISSGIKKGNIEKTIQSFDYFTIKLEGLPSSDCLILKYKMLEVDGTLFFSDSILDKGVLASDVILSGSKKQLELLKDNLKNENNNLSELGKEIIQVTEHYSRNSFNIDYSGGSLKITNRPLIMGVINITPDSFFDGGDFYSTEHAIEHGIKLVEAGADILDVGGESTRPGAEEVSVTEELNRVIPVIGPLTEKSTVPISIDTYKAEVALEAIAAGAKIVNDVTGLYGHRAMAEVVAEKNVPVILMHMKGTPKNMQAAPKYKNLISEIMARIRQSIELAKSCGINFEKTIIDPGIGFGKTLEHNLEIIDRLNELKSIGRPILIGTSRKSFIGKILDQPPKERLLGTAASVAAAVLKGANILRVHDVAEIKDVLSIISCIMSGEKTEI